MWFGPNTTQHILYLIDYYYRYYITILQLLLLQQLLLLIIDHPILPLLWLGFGFACSGFPVTFHSSTHEARQGKASQIPSHPIHCLILIIILILLMPFHFLPISHTGITTPPSPEFRAAFISLPAPSHHQVSAYLLSVVAFAFLVH